MTVSKETLAAVRFGFGFRPDQKTVAAPIQLLDQLQSKEDFFPLQGEDSLIKRIRLKSDYRRLRRKQRRRKKGAVEKVREMRKKIIQTAQGDLHLILRRAVVSELGFAERLSFFWLNHFAVSNQGVLQSLIFRPYFDEAIRPHIAGRFGDLLTAVTLHPAMLVYLNQVSSFGPASKLGMRKNRGLNENLARELLELHTMGVSSGYSQKDVRQLAELLTGLSTGKNGGQFVGAQAEPGAETVLGKTYGENGESRNNITEFLADLSLRPEAARHIAFKLARHFVSDEPDPALVAAMANAYEESQGYLPTVYEVLLAHPASQAQFGEKIKQPVDLMISAMRVFAVNPQSFSTLPVFSSGRRPGPGLVAMGQNFGRTPGPDGWPEAETDWITPQGLATRLDWIIALVSKLGAGHEPEEFLHQALGDIAGDSLKLAISQAAGKSDALALVLASPEFNRR